MSRLRKSATKVHPKRALVRACTDMGNAERFAKQHAADVHYCYQNHRWFVWDGRRWRLDDGALIETKANETVKSILVEAAHCADDAERRALAEWALVSQSAKRPRAMLELARSLLPIDLGSLDNHPELLNTANGTIDLTTGKIRPSARADNLTQQAPVSFSSDAKGCPVWLQFLERVFAGDADLISFVQRAVGYSLTGYTSEHALFIAYGDGANGKSTFLGVLQAMLGADYAMKAPPDFLIAKKNQEHPTGRADLFGKRLVTCIEVDDGQKLAESHVKELTGGDRIRARRMHKDHFEFPPSHKLWLAANHLPHVRGTDNGIWRRIKLIPFTVAIPAAEQDRDLAQKLASELPEILRWAVEGAVQWHARGLGDPPVIQQATAHYRDSQDSVGTFLAECCIENSSGTVASQALFGAYEGWCLESGEMPVSRKSFGTALTKRGYERFRSNGYRYRGLALQRNERNDTEPLSRKCA